MRSVISPATRVVACKLWTYPDPANPTTITRILPTMEGSFSDRNHDVTIDRLGTFFTFRVSQ
jgi:hypothetical protein